MTVVDHDGLTIDELVGNVASQNDALSIAKVTVTKATAEPWLTVLYDEWICVLQGTVEMHYGDNQVLKVSAGETCFVQSGERFRPVFPGPCEYIPVCLPAFKPELCHREEGEQGVSDVSKNLRELHGTTNAGNSSTVELPSDQALYHMCQKSLWEQAVASGEAYFPPTFEKDGGFTHATAVPARLLDTANHFYTFSHGDWICLELCHTALKKLGIVTRLEKPKAVGDTETDNKWNEWLCPHIFGGIPAQVDGVLKKLYPMKRDDKGNFLSIEGLTD